MTLIWPRFKNNTNLSEDMLEEALQDEIAINDEFPIAIKNNNIPEIIGDSNLNIRDANFFYRKLYKSGINH